MIEITEIRIALDDGASEEKALASGVREACHLLSIAQGDIENAVLHRLSVDARKKRDVHFTATIRLSLCLLYTSPSPRDS